MNRLFELLQFQGRPYLWAHATRSTEHFKGYYHWHQGCELLLVHEGAGKVIVNQQSYDIRRGMLFFFQPFQLHHVFVEADAATPYVRTVFHFDPAPLESGLAPFPRLQHLYMKLKQGTMAEQAFDLAEELDVLLPACEAFTRTQSQEAQGKQRVNDEEEAGLLLLQFLSAVNRRLAVVQPDNASARTPRYSEVIMQWVEAHYGEAFELERLSEELHLSKAYVSRVFQRETGSSLTDYIAARRMKEACRLLQTTDLPIRIIGECVGLSNTSYFISAFKKVIGSTPYKYKRNASQT
ncbi:transcriptional regulator, AraC family [Paenibacillus curdlanolyticus YK9]|uniref:Transcriptional regulator, AraC family n=1 Tax=Paenibacillus curdlanolyticus YK9 TaxID=717606 RepID=E0IAR7_9BACL|nr:AraC family transcriptional regulator [Paenibacillus curdlanolyticus]EFM10471.1 transcriptional regulator, AraC family [Paenibacillus curdlanolyticus YK9]